jgi:CRP-like cAMP-binding protein/predicted GNAT family N-acyltransferase
MGLKHYVATTQEQLAAVYRLRYEIYVESRGLFRDEADHERRWLTDEHDRYSHIIFTEVDGVLAGTLRFTWGAKAPFTQHIRDIYDMERLCRVVDERDMLMASRGVIHPKFRGSGVMPELFLKGFEFAATHGVELILGNCEPALMSHYEELGFRCYGKLYNHPTNGVLVPVAIIPGDCDILRRLDSPILVPFSRSQRAQDVAARLVLLLAKDTAILSEAHGDAQEFCNEVHRHLSDGGRDPGLALLGDILSDRDQASALLAQSHVLSCSPGDALIRSGHSSQNVYILLSGSLQSYIGGELVSRSTKPGALIGELAFFTGQKRMTDVIAGPEGARVLSLCGRALHKLIGRREAVAVTFLHYATSELAAKLLQQHRAP